MSVHVAKPNHEIAYLDLCALVNRHAGKVNAVELLALAANMVGKLIALQDQRTMTPEMAMEIVVRNLKMGNQETIEQLVQSKGGKA